MIKTVISNVSGPINSYLHIKQGRAQGAGMQAVAAPFLKC